MKGKIEDGKSKIKESFEKKQSQIMPEEFEVIDLIVKGKKIIVNMKELLEIANCENKVEIINAMNKASTYYGYFGKVSVDLEDYFNQLEEDFSIWLASKMSEKIFENESSEKAKERKVAVMYQKEYEEKKSEIREIKKYFNYAEIAKKTIEKNIGLIQSIGAMVRNSAERPVNPGNDDFE